MGEITLTWGLWTKEILLVSMCNMMRFDLEMVLKDVRQ
jgi:hypothetical protein